MDLSNFQDLSSATRQVATKSALNPIQWICALTTPASIAAACFTAAPICYIFVLLACIPVVYFLRAYDHFLRKDPDRLQSEKYLIERQIAGRIGINGPTGPEIILTGNATNVENPLQIEDQNND